MDLSTLKKRPFSQVDMVGAVVCVAASLGAYFGVFGPLMAQRSFLASQRQELARASEKACELKASMSILKNRLAVARKELAASEFKLEEAWRINQHVAEITTFLSDCGLKVDQVQIGPAPIALGERANLNKRQRTDKGSIRVGLVGSRCDLIPISISGKGGYKQCAAFLHQLCRTFPDISVAAFELQSNPAKPGQGTPAAKNGGWEPQPGTFRFELFWLAMSE
ncbi:MAG: hypothetical protein ACE5NM_04590 [Sedimentisphaerales bacterium]